MNSFVDNPLESPAKPLAEMLQEPVKLPVNQLSTSDEKSRTPASTTIKPEKTSQQIATVIFCDQKDLNIKSENHLLMLELTSCSGLKEKHQLWVTNESNGFKAQVFKLSTKRFKTDFIQLNSGTNKIQIEGVLKDGQKITQTLYIESAS